MVLFLKFLCCLLYFFSFLYGEPTETLLQYLEIAGTKIYFYETNIKTVNIQKIQEAVNTELSLNVEHYEIPWPITQVVVSSVHNLQSLYKDTKHPIVVPPSQIDIINGYLESTLDQINQIFGTHFYHLTKDLNLIYSQHAHKFHKDVSKIQAEVMLANPGKYRYIQELTLMDWEMQPGTVSGTLFCDERSKDRYLLTLFPNQQRSFLILDSEDHVFGEALPYHCALAPIDLEGRLTNGSEKGQRLSFAIRALGEKHEIDQLLKQSVQIGSNTPTFLAESERAYPNGIIVKSLKTKPGIFKLGSFYVTEDIDVIDCELIEHESLYSLFNLFNLDISPLDKILLKRVIKKTPGFSSLKLLGVGENYDIIALNHSSYTDQYEYVNLAQGPITTNRFFIQLYHIPPSQAMFIPSAAAKEVYFTPNEEILFRNAEMDHHDLIPPHIRSRIYTMMDLIFIPKPSY